jgi:hypothetical protein
MHKYPQRSVILPKLSRNGCYVAPPTTCPNYNRNGIPSIKGISTQVGMNNISVTTGSILYKVSDHSVRMHID